MNTRIRQLVKQAGGHFSTHNLMSDPVQHRDSIELWDDRIEKFAELIVRECIDIADEYDGAGSTIVSRIKQHFGVEE